jgi:hypothetical protein
MRRATGLFAGLALILAMACGGSSGGGDDGDSDGDGVGGDGGGDPGTTQCSNGVDDDDDGLADGQDPECTGAADDDEGSFATGIPGDNVDGKWQDCFFDGDSGAGNDGCRFHTCCLLGAAGGDDCPVDHNFDPARDCPEQADRCVDFCAPLTPAGCDCFGCCTICDPATDVCRDVLTNPAVAPDCTLAALDDADACPTCTKNPECGGGGCEPEGCTLCPGQTADDLPAACEGENACPAGGTPCPTGDECAAFEFCSSGCCIASVQ